MDEGGEPLGVGLKGAGGKDEEGASGGVEGKWVAFWVARSDAEEDVSGDAVAL